MQAFRKYLALLLALLFSYGIIKLRLNTNNMKGSAMETIRQYYIDEALHSIGAACLLQDLQSELERNETLTDLLRHLMSDAQAILED